MGMAINEQHATRKNEQRPHNQTVAGNPPVRPKFAEASKAAAPAFNQAVDYLKRRAEKGKLNASGPDDAPIYRLLSKSHARKASKAACDLTHARTTAANLSANAVASGTKVAAGLAKAVKNIPGGAQAAELGSKVDLGASGAGVALNGVALAASTVRFKNIRSKKKAALKDMTENLEKARAHVNNPEAANAETAKAYRKFTAAAKLVLHKDKDGWIPGTSDLGLEQQQAASTVARYAISTSSNIVSVIGAGANSAAASPAGPFLAAAVGPFEAIGATATLESGRRKSHKLNEKLATLESWRYQRTNAGLELPVNGICRAYAGEVRRQERLVNWVKRGARIQFAKATGNMAFGIAGGVMLSLGLAAVVGTAVLTAGIVVAAAAAALSAAYLAYVAVRTARNARSERHGKRSQMQAQALIATHPRDQLRGFMRATDPESRKAIAVTVERGGPFNAGRRTVRLPSVDAGRNAYVGLHLMSHELSDMIGRGDRAEWPKLDAAISFLAKAEDPQQSGRHIRKEAGAVLRLLQASGMSPFEIQTLCDAASAMKGEDRILYLKRAIAGAIGIPFRVDSSGKEKALTPFAYLGRVQDLIATPGFAANALSSDKSKNFKAAKALFAGLDYHAFAKAMADPGLPPGGKVGSAAHLARKLVLVEAERRRGVVDDHLAEKINWPSNS